MSESILSNQIALALSSKSKGKVITWRNNVGNGVCGKIHVVDALYRIKVKGGVVDVRPGDFVVTGGRRVQYGLCPGSSDRIGLKSVTITPDMVGQTVAIFVAMEVKTERGRLSDEQKNFIRVVNEMGGLSGCVRSVEDAVGLCGLLGGGYLDPKYLKM